MVFAELYWTPGVMLQCEDRAHRIGQTSTVAVHYLVARETMDEWVWSAVCRKVRTTLCVFVVCACLSVSVCGGVLYCIVIAANPPGFPGNLPDFLTCPGIPDFNIFSPSF